MKPVPFEYCRPASVADALALLAEMKEEAAVLAGGMTLGPMLNLRLVRPRAVIDVTRIGELANIKEGNGTLTTGATVIQADAMRSPTIRQGVPLLALALPWVGHFQTRNRGTLGGSVAHADPSAEIPLCLVTLDGWVVLGSRRRQRRMRAHDFFLGALATARRPEELLTAMEWPLAPFEAGHAFSEISQRHGDFAIAAAACQARVDADGRLAALAVGLGGVENRPVAIETREFLGRRADGDAAAEIAALAGRTVTPIEDHVADAAYRLAVSRVLVERVVLDAIADAQARRAALQ
jgi:2-furoyl-CoA dehydrogenase FAD binding subunit